jgi:hypothetical protein
MIGQNYRSPPLCRNDWSNWTKDLARVESNPLLVSETRLYQPCADVLISVRGPFGLIQRVVRAVTCSGGSPRSQVYSWHARVSTVMTEQSPIPALIQDLSMRLIGLSLLLAGL